MSLHYKIVLLFIGVAVLPLLIFATFARQQSLAAADISAEATLLNRVTTTLEIVEREVTSARSTLQALAYSQPGEWTAERLEVLLRTGVGPQPEGFAFIAVLDEDGTTQVSSGVPRGAGACLGDRFTAPVRIEVPLGNRAGRLVAEFRPGRGVDFRGVESAWLRDSGGQLVMAWPCGAEKAPPEPSLGGAQMRGTQSWDLGSPEAGTLAYARGSTEPWTFAATGVNLLRAPLGRLFRYYWLFVLGLGATAVLAFSRLLRRVTGSLAELTDAAERVANGDLRPWLPTPRNDEVGHLTAAFSRMTDRLRDLVDQVDRTGRLAILGQLSAYLAHEIRNPLSAVKMNLQRLQRWQRAGEIPDRCSGAIQMSLREVDRLASAVSNILQLTPGEPRDRETVCIHDLVSEAARLLDSEFTQRGVGLRWELNARADRVLGDSGQLKGVIINLMLNALEAQPDGGKLLILSELRPGPEERSGPIIELHFVDSGHGIPAGIAGRVFDPFFSTKEQGSGIGLAVARQTIRDHGGDIRLEQRQTPEGGAEVVVQLPLAAVAPEGAPPKTDPQVPEWGQGGLLGSAESGTSTDRSTRR